MTTPPQNSVHPKSRADWRKWLEKNHTRAEGVWFISYKKETGKPRVTYEESVEEALCFGWIDSKGNKLDDERSMLWFAPRKEKSNWSKPNKERVERLIQQGLMTPAGLAKIELAKKTAHGRRWMVWKIWKSRLTLPKLYLKIKPQKNISPPSHARSNAAFWNGF